LKANEKLNNNVISKKVFKVITIKNCIYMEIEKEPFQYTKYQLHFFFSLLLLFLISVMSTAQISGSLAGYVREFGTQKPLEGANITLEGSDLGTSTDNNGYFRLQQIPTRSFTVRVSLIGYREGVAYDVTITSGNTTQISFELEPEMGELKEVVVKRSRLTAKPQGSVNSIQSLGYNEISKYPGANFDIAKVVQSLPGVSGSVGFRNDIIIRGGAPNENVYYLDGIEIPTINHFATQGAAGGPVGILNVAFVDQVTLHTGAFPAKYDNPLSGALIFRQRSGNPDKVEGNFRLSASEAALTLEGPLGSKGGKTTYLVSARRSYLQFLFKLIDLPFLPDYWDYQAKVVHKPDNKNEIGFISLGSIDNFTFNYPEDPTLEQQAILDGLPLNAQQTNTVGLYWKRLINKGFWQISLSNNFLNNTADQWEDNRNPKDDELILKFQSREAETRLRYEYNKVWNDWSLSAGANLINARFENRTFQRRVGYQADFNNDFTMWRYGAFAQAGHRFFNRKLNVNFGLRTDGNTYTETGNDLGRTISPRLALAYTLAPGWTLNTSVGRYFKIQPYTILGFKEDGVAVNKDVDYIQSDHVVAGIEFTPSNATRITLEGFRKWYDNYPVSDRRNISMANLGGDFGVFGNERVVTVGRGRTWGAEFTYQQQLVKNFYGILAYTWYYSEFTNKDRDNFLPSGWDNRHLVSFTGGYRFPRNWEVGVRFRYQGKAPATPIDIFTSLETYPFTGQGVLDDARINSLRLDAFNAMDLRVDKKWNFRGWSLNLFLDIQNLYNSLNPTQPGFTLQRNPDGSIATTTGVPYNPGSFDNPAAPNNRQDAIPVILARESGSRLPSVGFVVAF
jgi:hypothetical protein